MINPMILRFNLLDLKSVPEEILSGLADADNQEHSALCLLDMGKAGVKPEPIIVRKKVFESLFVGVVVLDVVVH